MAVATAVPWRAAGWRSAVVAFAFAVGAVRSGAQDIAGYPSIDAFDPREVAMLPEYCKYSFYFREKVPGGNDTVAIERWFGTLGPTFQHIHHYCFGLMKTNRAVLLARTEQLRISYLNESIREFDYVLDRSTPDFALLPEVLSKKAASLVRLGKGPIAVLSLERAAELKPDYWPVYAQLSDYYKDVGDIVKAREVLDRGLSFSPDASALTRRAEALRRGK